MIINTWSTTIKILILIVLWSSFTIHSKAQLSCALPSGSGYPTPASTSCNNTNSNTNPAYINKYKKITTWIPDNNEGECK